MSSSSATQRNLKPSPTAPIAPSIPQKTSANDNSTIKPAPPVAPAVQEDIQVPMSAQRTQSPTTGHRKRKSFSIGQQDNTMEDTGTGAEAQNSVAPVRTDRPETSAQEPKIKKSRTNTPWTPAEELRLKHMRDAGKSWSEIAKTFPQRTEGSVKKHWYKDMHYAEFAEDESTALLAAIKEYDANKWKAIGQKVGKPAKACEQYAKEHFSGKY